MEHLIASLRLFIVSKQREIVAFEGKHIRISDGLELIEHRILIPEGLKEAEEFLVEITEYQKKEDKKHIVWQT